MFGMTADQWNLFWRRVRLWGLIGLLTTEIGSIALMAIYHHWEWVIPFLGINFCIIGGEAASYIAVHKTMSTRYGEWIQDHPTPALGALGLFLFAMISLCVHLIGYAFVPKKDK